MIVELVAVGDELLLGDTVNGNAAELGGRLVDAGLRVERSVVVGDRIDHIAEAIRTALGRADAVVITGGIGPTQDDLTREGLAAAAGVELQRDDALVQALRARFVEYGRRMPEMNVRQADVPVGATAIPNPRGTAPGLRMELLGGVAYVLPGVPREMSGMFSDSVLPDLLARAGDRVVITSRTLRTSGIGESEVAERLAPEVERCITAGNPTIAFLAGGGLVRVRITATAATSEDAQALIAPVETFARDVLGDAVFGADDDSLDRAVHRLLAARGATVAVAESLTGGLVGAALTDMPGSSATFRGGVVAYATDLKASVLGVPGDLLAARGAVAPETAVAMAEAARDRLGATYGLATTGVAGPDLQEGRPAGTLHVAVAGPGEPVVRSLRLPGDRGRVRQIAVVTALDLLRRALEPHGVGQ